MLSGFPIIGIINNSETLSYSCGPLFNHFLILPLKIICRNEIENCHINIDKIYYKINTPICAIRYCVQVALLNPQISK